MSKDKWAGRFYIWVGILHDSVALDTQVATSFLLPGWDLIHILVYAISRVGHVQF
jgi:hypothetical protein